MNQDLPYGWAKDRDMASDLRDPLFVYGARPPSNVRSVYRPLYLRGGLLGPALNSSMQRVEEFAYEAESLWHMATNENESLDDVRSRLFADAVGIMRELIEAAYSAPEARNDTDKPHDDAGGLPK